MIKLTSKSGKYNISNPEERIRLYCQLEIYRGYDDCHDINNVISEKNIKTANKLFARISKDTSEKLVKSLELRQALSSVKDEELGELTDSKWEKVQIEMFKLLEKAHSIDGVRLAVATKVLHLKRPKLIPILDSYIVTLLLERNIPENKAKLSSLAIEVIDIIRCDLVVNYEEFQKLRENLADLPIQLEIVRIYDILAWTQQKWDRLGIRSTPY